MEIPIKNIYYLLSYAWGYFHSQDLAKVERKDFETSIELFGELYDLTLTRYVKSGLKKDYVEFNEELSTIKSKIDFSTTLKRAGHRSKRYTCIYDEFTENNGINQLIKYVGFLLLKSDIKDDQKKSIKKKIIFFSSVNISHFNLKSVQKVKYTREDKNLNFLIDVCKYIFERVGFSQNEGQNTFGDFLSNKNMPMIYEKFVLNFYRKHLKSHKVRGGEHIAWDSETSNELYPVMKTDIVLRSLSSTCIIDTKFYKDIFSYNFNTPKFKSGNIYQLYTYMQNFGSGNIQGMLLYPTTHSTVRNERWVSGKKIMINTVNLNQDWTSLESELLSLSS